MIDTAARFAFTTEHEMFRDAVRKVFEKDLIPHLESFETEGICSRAFWKACGDAGMLCPTIAPEYGGLGLDFGYNAVVAEELGYAGSSAGITLQSDITAEYIASYGSEAQKRKYLPGMVSGDIISAIAMTEPSTGSDLQGIRTTARRDGDHYVINGSKTYITNGQNADVIIVVAKTNPEAAGKGISLILVDADTPGFARGRNLDKIGQHSADTSELFFEDVRVTAQACAQRAFDEAVGFTRDRKAFGQAIIQFQNTKFTLGDLKAQLQVGWAHLDWAITRHIRGELTTAEASAAKLWHTELQGRVCDAALQLHGGAGYMNEYMIARLWRDARVTRIFGGTSEIMKEVISRSI